MKRPRPSLVDTPILTPPLIGPAPGAPLGGARRALGAMAAAPPWGSGRVQPLLARGWYLSTRERREENEEEEDGETAPLLPPPPGSVRV